MNYGSDCGCSAPAPKPVKTIGVQPLAPTEEIVCPDSRCMPHLLNSLPMTDDSVPNYVGVYKGQSYIAPVRAAVDSVIVESMNDVYRQGKLPVVTNYRDLETIPVIQKENCQKMAVAAFPTIAKAMTEALPAAPANYEPSKVMTTDKDGDVYLATALQVVSPELIPAIIDNCEKGKFKNIPVLSSLLGFGANCKEFGETTVKQLQEAIAKALPLAPAKTLPDVLRGFKDGVEYKYPTSVSPLVKYTSAYPTQGRSKASGPAVQLGRFNGPLLQKGLWSVTIGYTGAIGLAMPANGYAAYIIESPIGRTAPALTMLEGNPAAALNYNHVFEITKVISVATAMQLYAELSASGGIATECAHNGEIYFVVQQLAESNLVVNGVS